MNSEHPSEHLKDVPRRCGSVLGMLRSFPILFCIPGCRSGWFWANEKAGRVERLMKDHESESGGFTLDTKLAKIPFNS